MRTFDVRDIPIIEDNKVVAYRSAHVMSEATLMMNLADAMSHDEGRGRAITNMRHLLQLPDEAPSAPVDAHETLDELVDYIRDIHRSGSSASKRDMEHMIGRLAAIKAALR